MSASPVRPFASTVLCILALSSAAGQPSSTVPSLIMQRGTYDLIKTAALDTNLAPIWKREARNPHKLPGPGTHGLITADVDDDGRDELILGATALDDDGSVLWDTGLGHPDPCFVADIDPKRPGLEIFFGIEPRRSTRRRLPRVGARRQAPVGAAADGAAEDGAAALKVGRNFSSASAAGRD